MTAVGAVAAVTAETRVGGQLFVGNFDDDKIVTLRLYSGNKDHRILQEAILGFGGMKLLNELNFTDSIVGNIVSFSTLATLAGTFASPILLRKFGFWSTAATASIPLALSNLITPFIESLSLLIILRLIAGFGRIMKCHKGL